MSNGKNTDRLRELLDKQQWTEEEQQWLLQYLDTTDQKELRQLMTEQFDNDAGSSQSSLKAESLLLLIHSKMEADQPKGKTAFIGGWKRLIIAASVVLVLSIGLMTYLYHTPGKETAIVETKEVEKSKSSDRAPGRNNAVLTLSDGSVIVLDSAANGALAHQGGTRVLKINGQITYRNAAGKLQNARPVYNTITTANGNQYEIVLEDGSKVWLNAASSIRFPTAFTGMERKVEITGEAYFEVAASYTAAGQKIPFTVKVTSAFGNDYEVQVVGTHFNINAYDDEAAIRTTLVEGKVKIVKGNRSALLKPLQQAVFKKENRTLLVQAADVEEAIAWKEGQFEFHDADIQNIMRQLSRWYDVDVKFSGPLSSKSYNGSIRRQATLSQVLQILKLAGVIYTIEGRTVTISTN